MNQPQNFLAIPDVNDFLPFSVAPKTLFGLLVSLVAHGGGHGVPSRVKGADMESMGAVLLTILPVGAFARPSKENQRRIDRGGRSRMFAADVTSNFAVTLVASALLFNPVIGSISVAPGVTVSGAHAGPPVDAAGISGGDHVTAVEGTPVNATREFGAALLATDVGTMPVELDSERTVSVTRELVAAGPAASNPASLTAESGSDPICVTTVNETAISVCADFESVVGDSWFARLDTSAGERVIPVGAYITNIAENGPLHNTTKTTQPLIISSFNGERVTSSTELQVAPDRADLDQTVTVGSYRNGGLGTVQVTLGENPQDRSGFLGANIFQGTSDLPLADLGMQEHPAGACLSFLSGNSGDGGGLDSTFAGSSLQFVYVSLLLPFVPVVLGVPNFPGFIGEVTNFYQVGGPFDLLSGGVLIFASALLWMAWIDPQLELFNCISGYPLDGDRILRTSTEVVASRLPVDDPHTIVRTITISIGLTMFTSPVFMIFEPALPS